MAAGMRLAGILRDPFDTARFGDGQGIHVGAQANCRPITMATLDDADHACASDACFHKIATEGFQLVFDKLCSFVHVIEKFRILVQFSAPCGNFRLRFNGTIQHWHFLMAPRIGRDLKETGYDVSVKAGNPCLPFHRHMA